MSFESGRKLGLTASIIYIIVPIITIALYGFLILSIFSAASNAFTGGGSSSPFGAFLSFGAISIAFIGLGLLSLISFIFFIISMYQLSHYYNEPGIFKNVLYGIVVAVVGAVSFALILIAIIISAINRTNNTTTAPALGLVIIGFLALIGALLVIIIISSFFWKRAFNKLAEKSGNNNFNTAGLLILIGATTSIIGIGALIGWIAWIFAAMGFNSLKPKTNETSTFPYSAPQTPTPFTAQKMFCPYCGSEHPADSIYCPFCGKKLM